MRTKKHFSVYFRLYKMVISKESTYERWRGDLFGIAVAKDENALLWQSIQMRKEILEAHLEGRIPNWYMARYLSNEERERRNNSYMELVANEGDEAYPYKYPFSL